MSTQTTWATVDNHVVTGIVVKQVTYHMALQWEDYTVESSSRVGHVMMKRMAIFLAMLLFINLFFFPCATGPAPFVLVEHDSQAIGGCANQNSNEHHRNAHDVQSSM